ncbi:major facilitator superfamily domain-containing protein [Pestalotiopsis sp. NC0098]|nr:major facilitator superfamily domain-containing protein [Pestalotiopsis sp. NC0098]
MKLSYIWASPEVNPINRKARSVPFLNPINVYGRVFFFSWFGFMTAFWAWYTFPPLLSHTIKSNLGLSSAQVANSNIVSLCATLLIRFIAGPLCDQFGPRWVFAGLLLVGSIPLGLAPLVHDATGLYVSRFFIGILGGAFVPCMVWSTGFFDKNVVGTANALTGGWGNAGGGITYFIMPAVFDSLKGRGYADGQAWRITFIVPLIIVIATALGMITLCPDTPTGKWSERHLQADVNLHAHGVTTPTDGTQTPTTTSGGVKGGVVDVPGAITDKDSATGFPVSEEKEKDSRAAAHNNKRQHGSNWDHEAAMSQEEMRATAKGEVVAKPSLAEGIRVLLCLQTAFHVSTYFCSFGGELAINSILGAYYLKNFPGLGQTGASNWAAMFGFLNFVTRPLGGVVSDFIFKATGHNLWGKKFWIVLCGCVTGALLIIIGRVDPHDSSSKVFGLVALMAVFLEAGNGANFSLVPHVHPHANGFVSGVTGAGGNLGGVVFAVIFRFMDNGTDYARAFWIIGAIMIGLNLALSWVKPLPAGQIGGR